MKRNKKHPGPLCPCKECEGVWRLLDEEDVHVVTDDRRIAKKVRERRCPSGGGMN